MYTYACCYRCGTGTHQGLRQGSTPCLIIVAYVGTWAAHTIMATSPWPRVRALWRLPPGRLRRELVLFVQIAAPSVVIQMAQFMIVRLRAPLAPLHACRSRT